MNMNEKPLTMQSWANGSCPATATNKENISSKKKKKQSKKSLHYPKRSEKKNRSSNYILLLSPPSHLKATSPSAPSSHATHPSPKSDSSHHQKPHPPSQPQPSKDHQPSPDPLQSDVCSEPNSTQNYSSQSPPKHYICSKLPNRSELVDPTRNLFPPLPIRLRGGGQIWKRR